MRFSLVIPVAPERDAEIIESIKKLDYPRNDFHVVVVKGKNPSENRNRGFEKARGNYIVFLDDDAIIKENYLKKVDEFLNDYSEVDVIGGPQLTPETDKGFAKISGYALSSKFGAWKISNRYSTTKEKLNVDETSLTSANLIAKREVFEKIKFDPKLFPGEDPKFISDAKKNKFKVGYSPNIVVYHRRRTTIKGFIKQIFSYGKTRPQKENFFETLKKPFFLVPAIFLIYLVLLLAVVAVKPSILGNIIAESVMWNSVENVNITSNIQITGNVIRTEDITKIGEMQFKFNYWVLLFLPLVTYIILALLFSIYDSLKNKNLKAVFILPFIYLMIHLSYGAGMIYGYVRKLY